jgi:hypothetical protein
VVRRVIHGVNGHRQRKVKARDEIVGDGHALGKGARLRIANILIDVRLHLPFVLRMSFANVHREKIGAVFVFIVDLDEISNLAAEGRSSVAAKNEHERTAANLVVQIKGSAAIQREYARVRRAIADVQITLVPLRQGVAKEAVNISRAAHEMGEREISREQQESQARENPFP